MTTGIKASELILNPDGSIYHLNLLPEDIADTIILVGDPNRVSVVSSFFDEICIQKSKREFVTHTGYYQGKKITVISTGIGTDNIDIVINELDALVNIDLKTRQPQRRLQKLHFVRIGTSGSIQKDIPVGSFVISSMGLGFDNLVHFYDTQSIDLHPEMTDAFVAHTAWNPNNAKPYFIEGSAKLLAHMHCDQTVTGITGTNVGFYGPQGRQLRLRTFDQALNDNLSSFRYQKHFISNLEMETSAIYSLAKLLGHEALSLNCIIANRANGTFSEEPKADTKALISFTLDKLKSL
ncbi:MAG: nucleoside phosphorylase [Flavobacteriaceae bacterium]|nr:nucleoside phosphorylase [Flavobacteriaceae bacterium]